MNKAQIVGWFLTISTVLDTVWGVVAENSGLLADFGISPKATKIIMALSILWTAFNRSLAQKKEKPIFMSDNDPLPTDPPPREDDPIVGDRPKDRG